MQILTAVPFTLSQTENIQNVMNIKRDCKSVLGNLIHNGNKKLIISNNHQINMHVVFLFFLRDFSPTFVVSGFIIRCSFIIIERKTAFRKVL